MWTTSWRSQTWSILSATGLEDLHDACTSYETNQSWAHAAAVQILMQRMDMVGFFKSIPGMSRGVQGLAKADHAYQGRKSRQYSPPGSAASRLLMCLYWSLPPSGSSCSLHLPPCQPPASTSLLQ